MSMFRRESRGALPPFILMLILLLLLFLLFILPQTAAAQTLTSPAGTDASVNDPVWPGRLFPAAYFTDTLAEVRRREASLPYLVRSEEEHQAFARVYNDRLSLLLNNDILAFYGHPLSKNMGILGRFSIEELDRQLTGLAAEYAAANGGRGIKKAFYIIYGTVWPEGNIGILREDILLQYIEYALERGILVFLDHQIGRFNPLDSLKKMLPYLRYPNVHLALDPEWRTTRPMQEIGTISAEELNQAQQIMEDYIVENRLPGERMLVVHQFNWRMISSREQVRSNFARVRLVHCADGFGAPDLKRRAYAYNAQAVNMPVKGFKLFYDSGIPGAGFDNPLLTPEEVYALNPRPYIIMYQ